MDEHPSLCDLRTAPPLTIFSRVLSSTTFALHRLRIYKGQQQGLSKQLNM